MSTDSTPETAALPALPASTPDQSTTPTVSWRDRFTVVRMGVAFFFPWPFLTRRLEADAERRATRRSALRATLSRAGDEAPAPLEKF